MLCWCHGAAVPEPPPPHLLPYPLMWLCNTYDCIAIQYVVHNCHVLSNNYIILGKQGGIHFYYSPCSADGTPPNVLKKIMMGKNLKPACTNRVNILLAPPSTSPPSPLLPSPSSLLPTFPSLPPPPFYLPSLPPPFYIPSLSPPFFLQGVVAGGVGAVVGNPTEVSLVRMTLDGRWQVVGGPLSPEQRECWLTWWCAWLSRLPIEQQRGYKNVFDAMFRITREEGLLTLWRVGSNTYT